MKPDPDRHSPSPLAPALAALLACTLGSSASAQVSPYYIGVSQYLAHNSNVYRLGDGQSLTNNPNASKSDLVSATSLVAGIDQSFGRQRVYGSGTLGANRYQHNSNLNGETFNLSLGLDWSTRERLSGTLSASANQSLAQFNAAVVGGVVQTKKNLTNSEALNARFQIGVVTRYTAEASLGYRKQRYSAAEYEYLGYNESSGSVGLRFRPSSLLAMGAALRLTQASYPRFNQTSPGVFEADKLKRQDIDFTGDWQPSGNSSVNLRLSPTQTRYDRNTASNFSGLTGSANWGWQATGKSRLATTLSRDTSQSSQAVSLGIFGTGVSDYSQITTALQVRGSHELTGKVGLTAGITFAHRSLTSSLSTVFLPGTSSTGGEDSNTLSLGVRWTPTRSSQVGCDISTERRSSSNPALSQPLSAALFGCYGQLSLQSW